MAAPKELLLETAAALAAVGTQRLSTARALVGADGFIDEIVRVVDTRKSVETWTPVRTIADYARRLAAAAGKSTNVELVLEQTKMGGNGPLMCDALGALGIGITYVGAVGNGRLHPVFEPLRRHGDVHPIADPAVTIAAEFDDGKIMHGKLETLNEITPQNVIDRIGGEAALDALLRNADVLAMVNWTMIPNLTDVWEMLAARLAKLPAGVGPRLCFFDLCDPEKRPHDDRRRAMAVIASFQRAGVTPILGLNEKESAEICAAMGVEYGTEDLPGMRARIRRLIAATGIPEIVVHPRTTAAAVGPEGDGEIEGPYCAAPKLTTGAGDHFNGGYAFARAMGLAPRHAVVVGKSVSGFYVREGRGPSRDEAVAFLKRWAAGTLDPW